MNGQLSQNAQRIQDALNESGLQSEVVELPDSTRTALEAAQAIGCHVEQIVKSLVFKAKRTEAPVLVLTSGANRVDERKIEALIGEPLGRAEAEFVKQISGFSIGGVPPIGHRQAIETYIDEDLMKHEYLWAAAGTPHAVFQISSIDLVNLTGGMVADVKR
jgi:prolyl-tRNA editing enzyme YbaK/EbsC (Cys-tRNA(Pro) deacylase)